MEFHFYVSLIIIILFSFSSSLKTHEDDSQFHILDTTDNQSPVCKKRPADIGTRKNKQYTVLDLVQRDGACAPRRRDQNKVNTSTNLLLSVASILNRDQLRIKSLCSINKNPLINLSFESGQQYYHAGGYTVRLGLGSPEKQDVHLIMDTGSDVTWTQCQPCSQHCYKQQDKIFNPLDSTSYKNMPCKDPRCLALSDDHHFACYHNTTCMYGVIYGDQSYTVGFLGKDTLHLDLRAVFQNFIFGCGQNNNVTTGEEDAGVLGLSRHPLSLVSQIAAPNSRQFSYCLPTDIHSTGYLTLGKNNNTNVDVRFTPLTTCPIGLEPLYCVEIMSINIGNTKLPIKHSVFKNHTVVDSGTTLTYLPQPAYNALSKEFNRQMDKKKYPLVPGGYEGIFDTCYNTSKHKNNITHPLVSFTFKGNVTVNINPHGTLFPVVDSGDVVCLAFAAWDVSIFGNLAQMTHEVVYDVSGNQIGFRPSSCD